MNNEADNVLKKVCLIKIAIDMHLRNYRVVRQIESSKPQSAQTVPRPQALRASVAGGSFGRKVTSLTRSQNLLFQEPPCPQCCLWLGKIDIHFASITLPICRRSLSKTFRRNSTPG